MMTLRELMKKADKAAWVERVPSVAQLMKDGIPAICSEKMGSGIEVTALQNGYVIYQNGDHATVFPLHECRDYVEKTVTEEEHVLPFDAFADQPWQIRTFMEGEKRLVHNTNARRYLAGEISYDAVYEGGEFLSDEGEADPLRAIIEEELRREETLELHGVTTAYYVDPEKLIVLTGFFHTTASTSLLSIDTMDYQIEGRPGNWLAADEKWIDGQHFFLMQSQEFGKKAAYAVVDSSGKPAAQDTAEGFSEETIRQIREYIQRQNAARETPARAAATPPLENWQKSYENGEYLRSAEMAEEQNYSMIDGRMNNTPPKGPAHQRPARKRRKGKLPMKSRESVLKRLKEYQDELAAQRGQAVVSQDVPEIQERRKV